MLEVVNDWLGNHLGITSAVFLGESGCRSLHPVTLPTSMIIVCRLSCSRSQPE